MHAYMYVRYRYTNEHIENLKFYNFFFCHSRRKMFPFNKFIFQGVYGLLPLSESTNGVVSQKSLFSSPVLASQLYKSIMNWLNLYLFITIHSFYHY